MAGDKNTHLPDRFAKNIKGKERHTIWEKMPVTVFPWVI